VENGEKAITISKILNNNVAIARDEHGLECVVTGKGIAFDKKAGDSINPGLVEKVFSSREKGISEKLSKVVEKIPLEHLKICDEIINTAKNSLAGLSDKIYLTLIDHISFAIERHKDNMDLASSLKWELKRFYPEEFKVGLAALDIIEKRLNMRLPDDEAAFIAFHLVNAGTSVSPNLEESLRVVKEILETINSCFPGWYDADSDAYDRLLIHLKHFSVRIFNKDAPSLKQSGQGLLYRLQAEYPEESSCVEAVSAMIKNSYNYQTNDEEKSYLIIHIHSLLGSGGIGICRNVVP
jgi:beta-glucoside operon transcriptional antiterminator